MNPQANKNPHHPLFSYGSNSVSGNERFPCGTWGRQWCLFTSPPCAPGCVVEAEVSVCTLSSSLSLVPPALLQTRTQSPFWMEYNIVKFCANSLNECESLDSWNSFLHCKWTWLCGQTERSHKQNRAVNRVLQEAMGLEHRHCRLVGKASAIRRVMAKKRRMVFGLCMQGQQVGVGGRAAVIVVELQSMWERGGPPPSVFSLAFTQQVVLWDSSWWDSAFCIMGACWVCCPKGKP